MAEAAFTASNPTETARLLAAIRPPRKAAATGGCPAARTDASEGASPMDTHKWVKSDIDAKLDSSARPSHTSEEGGSPTDIKKGQVRFRSG